MKKQEVSKLANFLYEVGTLRKVARAHRQTLLTDDLSDNIASHSFRVAWVGYILAQMEKVDAAKVVMMCLAHDLSEARSGDQNWVHKKYVKVFEEEIIDEQFKGEVFAEVKEQMDEYIKRESLESLVAKDADLLDQLMLLREYEWRGNKEASKWLAGSRTLSMVATKSGKKLAKEILSVGVSDWWSGAFTSKRR